MTTNEQQTIELEFYAAELLVIFTADVNWIEQYISQTHDYPSETHISNINYSIDNIDYFINDEIVSELEANKYYDDYVNVAFEEHLPPTIKANIKRIVEGWVEYGR